MDSSELLDVLEAISEIRVEQLDLRSSVLGTLRLLASHGLVQAARLHTNAAGVRAVISHGNADFDEERELAWVETVTGGNHEEPFPGREALTAVLRRGKHCYGALVVEGGSQTTTRLLASIFVQWCAVAEFVASQKEELIDENYQLREEIRQQYSDRNIVGVSGAFQNVLAAARRVAASSATVLIEGETGTGKELIARLIHEHSPRCNRPFITVNCGALSESLLESELFGHVKGAFTGAIADRKGRFEAANGGTIFLDEIGEISANMQVKLLRVLQELEVVRVGDHKVRKLDVRVIAATNRDLEDEVRQGHFRSDLYYRLNVVYLHMPALRERPEDIPLLIEYFLGQHGQRNLKFIEHINREVLDTMKRYPWPGNVRELENCVEKLVVMAPRNVITMDLLPMAVVAYAEARQESRVPAPAAPSAAAEVNTQPGGNLEEHLHVYLREETRNCDDEGRTDLHQRVKDKWERHLFEVVLDHVRNNKSRAADLLGLTRTTLNKRLKELCTVVRSWRVD